MKTARIILLSSLFLITFISPLAVQAAKFPDFDGPILSCVGSQLTSNPNQLDTCTSFCNILQTAQNAIYVGLTYLVFVFTPILIAVGGLLIILSGGSESRLKRGKDILTGAIVGLVIGLAAFLIINTILYILGITGDPTGKETVAWPEIQCAAQGTSINNQNSNENNGNVALNDADAKKKLTNGGVTVVSPPPNLGGITKQTVDEVIHLKGASNCTLTVASGTGNQTAIKRNTCVDTFIPRNAVRRVPNSGDAFLNSFTNPRSGAVYAVSRLGNRGDPILVWHIALPPHPPGSGDFGGGGASPPPGW